MLNMIFGRSGYGKTEYVFSEIKRLIDSGEKDILLLTPEQYSFSSEKHLLNDLGEEGMAYVENISFSRLADSVKRAFGDDKLPVISNGAKAVVMMQAIDAVKGDLTLFSKKLDSSLFVNSMIKMYDEMKSCNLDSDEIVKLSSDIESDALMHKMNDIALIMRSYENIISSRFIDPSDKLSIIYNKLINKNFFKNKIIFIDGFNGFVAQEYKILELMINEAKSISITLCTDNYENPDNFNLFTYVNKSAQIIKKIAEKSNIDISCKYLTENYRANNNEIKFLEKNIFSDENDTFQDNIENISIYSALSPADECRETASKIKKLLRKGNRASDITVICRDLNKYRDELFSAFSKYEIPYYKDERQPVNCQSLVVFVEYLLRCVNNSFRSDDILSLAKTGMVNIPDNDINALENYVYLWNINGLKWTKEFENSTKGFVNEMTKSDKKALMRINNTRQKLISPIQKFKSQVKKANAEQICSAVYHTIIAFGADKKIKETAISLVNSGKTALALQQDSTWKTVMNILSKLPIVLGDDVIKLKDFAKSFSIMISAEDLGSIPSGIDNVQIGQADRIRTDNPKFVFLLGANEGEFPQSITGGGLLSENDRRILLEHDFKLYSYGEILNLQERYFAYMACCACSEKLFVSYSNDGGKNSSPSEIVNSIKNIFTNLNEYTYRDIDDLDLIESDKNAFELMSANYFENTPFYSSLKEYFKSDNSYNKIKTLAQGEEEKIKNKDVATSLFGQNMYISASRIEDFYNCRFRYFCKFGLGARPREIAKIDPMQRGTLIHFVLEKVLSDYGSETISKMSDNEITNLVDHYVSRYFVEEMGNVADVNIRFKYNYKRLSKLIYAVVLHLAHEFSQSKFKADAFEMKIDKDSDVKPEILNLDNGGTIQIRGSIDRVDTYEFNNQKFIRVVDYKSGKKDFSLSDVIYGLNLQMFIYLFSVCSNNENVLPAGVLYMHAARDVLSFNNRSEANSSIDAKTDDLFKMKGIVISDYDGEIAYAMENELNGKYIPVTMKKDGTLKGQLQSLEQLGKLHKKINSLIIQMGNDLQLGNIQRNPVKNKNHKNTCDFCDYADVCANVCNINNRITPDITDIEVDRILDEEYTNNAEMDTTTK